METKLLHDEKNESVIRESKKSLEMLANKIKNSTKDGNLINLCNDTLVLIKEYDIGKMEIGESVFDKNG